MRLTMAQRERYARQLALPEIGPDGQSRLAEGRVLVVGAGGLGSPVLFYLAAAGVGTLGIMDGDCVEASNLQRQILHATGDLGQSKAISAAETLRALNPDVDVRPMTARLTRENGAAMLAGFDFVIDATDNFESKFLIADLCHAANLPYSHAGIARFCGQTLTVLPGRSACYRCVFEAPPTVVSGPPQGPLGVVPGVIGSIQATEAIKYLLHAGALLTDRVFVYDSWQMTARCVRVTRRPDCALCGGHSPALEPFDA
jgi:molybdopterin/thiamine biosynthesis adenylyltransferase